MLVTVYDLAAREPLVLHSDTDPDVTMADAVAGLSAAPTYFEPVQVGDRTLIDGGMFATNPAVYAWVDTDEPPDLLLALGTGRQTRPLPFEDVRGLGQDRMGKPLVDIVSDGFSASAADAYLASSPATATYGCRTSCATRAMTSTTRARPTSRRCAAKPRS